MAIAIEMGTSSGTDEWLRSLMIEIKENEEVARQMGPTIPRVPSSFREVEKNRDCYDPKVVSIGPYHHGERQLERMEKLKRTLACQFVKESRVDAPEIIYSEVKNSVRHARGCYTDESTCQLDDEKLAQMMFLDGCFILQFAITKPEDLKMKSEDAALVTRDLFLQENQLPFPVLITLLKFSSFGDTEDRRKKFFEDFCKRIRAIPPRAESYKERMSNLFRRLAKTIFSTAYKSEFEHETFHLLGLFHRQFVGSGNELYDNRRRTMLLYRETSWNRYYPVNELKNVGIHFKPSNSGLFIDVQFKPTLLAGELHVPPLTIEDSTKPLLLNLAAYEACSELDDNWLTSYVCFMRSLIDKPEDVKDLRSKGILLTTLGSDQQVVELFKEMATNLVPSSDAFIKVKNGIEWHYRNTFKRCVHDYRGPVSTAIVKYSFLYGFIISGLQAYVTETKPKSGSGGCISPATNATRHL